MMFWLILALAACLPFGGNHMFLQALSALVVGLAVVWQAARLPRRQASKGARAWFFLAAAGGLAGLLALGLWQLWPAASGVAHPLWALVNPWPWPTISATPAATLLGVWFACLLSIFCVLIQQHKNPVKILQAGVIVIALAGAYGFVMWLSGLPWVLWQPKQFYADSLTGPFINRNHMATLLGLGVLGALGLGLARLGEVSSRLPFRQRLQALVNLVLRPGWPWLLLALWLLVLILLTQSRAGLAATGAGVLVMLLALLIAKPGTRGVVALALVSAGLLALGAFVLLGDDTASRLSQLGQDATIRHNLAQIGWRMLADAPWWGHGLGAFENAGTAYRTSAVPLWVEARLDHAHNDYVEWLAELGWLGGSLAALVGLAILLELTRLLRIRRRGVMWPALGLGTLALVGSHALVDFSLHMPLVALVTVVWLALALRNKDPEALTPTATAPGPLAPTWQRWGVMGLGSTSVVAALIMLWATWPLMASQQAWQRWQAGAQPATITQMLALRTTLTHAVTRAPHSATAQFRLGWLTDALAQRLNNPVIRAQAIPHLQAAVQHNPGNGVAWFLLGRALLRLNDPTLVPQAQQALLNSMLTQPLQPPLLWARLPWLMQVQPSLAADDQALLDVHFHQVWQALPRDNQGRIYRTPLTPSVLNALANRVANQPAPPLR
jgi:O-antigen ligase